MKKAKLSDPAAACIVPLDAHYTLLSEKLIYCPLAQVALPIEAEEADACPACGVMMKSGFIIGSSWLWCDYFFGPDFYWPNS